MKTPSVESFVVAQIRSEFPGSQNRAITRDLDLMTDLDADSLSIVSLITAIDEQFGVGAEELGALMQECRTVGDLISATERLIAAKREAVRG